MKIHYSSSRQKIENNKIAVPEIQKNQKLFYERQPARGLKRVHTLVQSIFGV